MCQISHGAEITTAVQTRKERQRGFWFTIVHLLDSYGRFIPKSEGIIFAKVRRRMKNILPLGLETMHFSKGFRMKHIRVSFHQLQGGAGW
jgi:hypothetical protein